MDPIRLNLGAGSVPLPGYTPIDRKAGGEVYPLQYPDASVDEIRASHVLEHFSHRQTLEVLREWARVLKPGGVLKIAVPDFGTICRAYQSKGEHPIQGWTMGGHTDDDDRHGAIFDEPLLRALFDQLGFIDVERWTSEIQDCAALPVSLNLQGRKAVLPDKLKVRCAMSVPRLGFTDNFFQWAEALTPFGIRPSSFNGAFWGQCLERVMKTMLDADWILTLDYDSFFTKDHIRQLMLLAANHPEADAIVPVQVKRGEENTPLMTMRDDQGKIRREVDLREFDPTLTRIHTGHFGCTMLRVEALKKVPHPWFKGEPNADGEWEDGRIDDDIWFWHRWAEAGNTAYLANRVIVGHGEYLVMLPDERFNVMYQTPSDYRQNGPKEGVRK